MNEEELKKLIKGGESESLEFKSSLSEWKKAIETLAAFAWTTGGKIIFGISKSEKIIGVDIGKGTIEKLANDIKLNTDPKIYPKISVKKVNGKNIILVGVEKVSDEPVLAFGRAHKRIDKSTHTLNREEYNRIILEKRKVYFDSRVYEKATLKDIDEEKVKWFLRKARAERRLDIDETSPVKEVLMRLNLLSDEKLTTAAILLFGKNPQKFFLQVRVRCARYKGVTPVDFIDLKIIDGNVIDQVDNTEKFILSHIKKAAKIVMFKREEVWEYPPAAIREAIVNAICHRDYASTSDITVGIFDDRIEISNPGKLPEPLTPQDLKRLHKSIPRNPLIANAFFLIKNIEQWGRGTNKIVDWCKEHGLKEPDFEEIAGGFLVKFYAPEDILALVPEPTKLDLCELGLNERQIEALRLMVNEGQEMTNKKYRKMFNTSVSTAKRDLTGLVKVGQIIEIGKGRSLKYVIEMVPVRHEPIREKKTRFMTQLQKRKCIVSFSLALAPLLHLYNFYRIKKRTTRLKHVTKKGKMSPRQKVKGTG